MLRRSSEIDLRPRFAIRKAEEWRSVALVEALYRSAGTGAGVTVQLSS